MARELQGRAPAASASRASTAAPRTAERPTDRAERTRVNRSSSAFRLYRSDVGKKYVMAITGLILMGYVLIHMVGNLKIYLGAESLNAYSEWLREVGEPALPREVLLWIARIVLLAAVALHIDAAYRLTRSNRRARPQRYQSERDFAAADFASRTMRWTGIIVALFVLFHLLDLTWGTANPDHIAGDPYH